MDAGSYNLATGAASWTYALDTFALSNGSHTLSARATDASGNTRIVLRSFSGCGKVRLQLFVSGESFGTRTVVVRTTDEMLRLVPAQMREAALSLGVPQWKVTVQVLYRSASAGIVTGIGRVEGVDCVVIANDATVKGSGTHDKTGRHCLPNDPNGKLMISHHAGFWLRDAYGNVLKKPRHLCWDGCMFPNEVMMKQQTWNDILSAMIAVRDAHGWREDGALEAEPAKTERAVTIRSTPKPAAKKPAKLAKKAAKKGVAKKTAKRTVKKAVRVKAAKKLAKKVKKLAVRKPARPKAGKTAKKGKKR